MINLIPPKGRTALIHEYILRVASVYGFLLAGVLLAGAALMIPTYVLVSSQLLGARDESSGVEETRAAFDLAFEEIQVANTVMAQLKKQGESVDHSLVIEEIVRVAPSGIRFVTFQANREKGTFTSVEVQGTASSRIALSTFKQALESSSLFGEALVPISDLARDTNLPFAITLTLEVSTTSSSETPS